MRAGETERGSGSREARPSLSPALLPVVRARNSPSRRPTWTSMMSSTAASMSAHVKLGASGRWAPGGGGPKPRVATALIFFSCAPCTRVDESTRTRVLSPRAELAGVPSSHSKERTRARWRDGAAIARARAAPIRGVTGRPARLLSQKKSQPRPALTRCHPPGPSPSPGSPGQNWGASPCWPIPKICKASTHLKGMS